MKNCPFCAEETRPNAIVCKQHSFALGLAVIIQMATPRTLAVEHLAAIEAVHSEHGWKAPTGIRVSSAGFVVFDYEYADRIAITHHRVLGETRLLAVREALLPFGFQNYRVNVNGPSPGTGLVRRYGSSRFIQIGGSVEWLTP